MEFRLPSSIRFLAVLVLMLRPSLCGAFWIQIYDGFDEVAANKHEVRNIVEVKRSPLFDNAPFLHLRSGDRLVRGLEVQRGKPWAFPDKPYTYLVSGGRYYLIRTEENDRFLSASANDPSSCLLFDWDLTLGNAQVLRRLTAPGYNSSITLKQYEDIARSVRLQFPELAVRAGYDILVGPDRLVSIPGQTVAEFQGIAYDYGRDCLYRYILKIGPTICSVTGDVLIQGPPYIERWQFEARSGSPVANDTPFGPDPISARQKQTQYDLMMRFKKLVEDVISPAGGPR